jgi:hypothetical protein
MIFFILLKRAFLHFRFRADKGKRKAALIPFGAFGVGDFFGNIIADRSAGKIFGMGKDGRPYFTVTVFYGDFKKFGGLGVPFERFGHKNPPDTMDRVVQKPEFSDNFD